MVAFTRGGIHVSASRTSWKEVRTHEWRLTGGETCRSLELEIAGEMSDAAADDGPLYFAVAFRYFFISLCACMCLSAVRDSRAG